MDLLSGLAVFFSVVYVVLAAINTKWCFLFGFIGSLIWCYLDYYVYNLLFDGGLQIFYAIMSIWGFIVWGKNKASKPSVIKRFSLAQNGLILLFGISVSFVLIWLVTQIADPSFAFLDAITTVFSVLATFMIIHKYIDNWIYLLVCDLLYIYIYTQSEAFIFAWIMVLYSILAVVGFVKWDRILKSQSV